VDASEEYWALRTSIQGRLKQLTLVGLRKNIDRIRKTLEHDTDPKLAERLSLAQEALRDFESGGFPALNPRVFFGRDDDRKLGGLLALFYRGAEVDLVAKHPASIALTGNGEEDAELRALITKDIETFIGEHGLFELYLHLTKGCPESECTWPEDICSTFAKSVERRKALEEARTELGGLRGLEKTVADKETIIENLRKEVELSKKEKDGLHATLTQRDKRLETVEVECGQLQRENVWLRNEASDRKTEAEKAILDLGFSIFYKRDDVVQWTKDGKLHERIKEAVKFLLDFCRSERGAVDFREQAKKGLSEEETRLIEADRVQLRDLGSPKFVNRRDLIRRFRRVEKATLDGLLAYRNDWDAKLAGQTIHQETFVTFAAGLPRWKVDPSITGLRTLARTSGVDRSTLRKYHRLGLVDLNWCIDDPARDEKSSGRARVRGRGKDRRPIPE
jgi:hypothetical protein